MVERLRVVGSELADERDRGARSALACQSGEDREHPGSAGDARDSRNGGLLTCAVLDIASEEVWMIDYPDPQRLRQGP